MLGNFACFLLSVDFFIMINSSWNIIRVANSLEPDMLSGTISR